LRLIQYIIISLILLCFLTTITLSDTVPDGVTKNLAEQKENSYSNQFGYFIQDNSNEAVIHSSTLSVGAESVKDASLKKPVYPENPLIPSPSISWQKSMGGSLVEFEQDSIQTTDGGYIYVGMTTSTDGDVTGNHGNGDYWVVKVSSIGDIQWEKCLGGSDYDAATTIQQTTDGGYIVAGYTYSTDGDVTGNHGNGDFWVVKLSSNGAIQWQKCLGGSNFDYANSIRQTTDGGYIVAGYTFSTDGDVSGNHGNGDFWVVKLSSNGAIQWQKCFGGSNSDYARDIQKTLDGGYLVVGYTYSNNGDVSGNHGDADYWVVKLSCSGTLQWQKCLGGGSTDWSNSAFQTTDSGYIVAGGTYSTDGDVRGNHGSSDYWVVKLSNNGNIQWQRCFGGKNDEWVTSIHQISSGGYIVGGGTYSTDDDVRWNHGQSDAWILKLSSNGNIQWQRCLGGSLSDWSMSSQMTSDGGYGIGGSSYSDNGDVSGNHGLEDYWVVKLGGIAADFTITPSIADPLQIVSFDSIVKGSSPGPLDWNFGDGSPSFQGNNPTHQYKFPGNYTVTLTVSNSDGKATVKHMVSIRGLIADFEMVPSGGWAIVNSPVMFKDTSKGEPKRWEWNFGDGTKPERTDKKVINHTYTRVGTYPVNMIAENWQPIKARAPQKQISIVEKSIPKNVDFVLTEGKQSGKAPFTVKFNDITPVQSQVTGWLWDFGDGTNSIERSPEHTYTIPGQYTVILTVRNEMGTNEARKSAFIVVT